MGTETLIGSSQIATDRDILAQHILRIVEALNGTIVGRRNNIATPSQDLGTQVLRFGTLFVNSIDLDGSLLDPKLLASPPNIIASGRRSSVSAMPQYLRPTTGTSLSATIDATETSLSMSIGGSAVSITEDVLIDNITPAPNAHNTAEINEPNIYDAERYGERWSGDEIKITKAGTNFLAKVGSHIGFRIGEELSYGFLKDANTITRVKRGYFMKNDFNYSGFSPLVNGETIQLLNLGYVFIDSDAVTVEVSYSDPIWAPTAPPSTTAGQYWFDTTNNLWRRNSGVEFEVVNRIYAGKIAISDVACVGARPEFFYANHSVLNNYKVVKKSASIVGSEDQGVQVAINGTRKNFFETPPDFDLDNHLVGGSKEPNTAYYLYLTEDGKPVIDKTKSRWSNQLLGDYHPHEVWRCVGIVSTDSSSDVDLIWDWIQGCAVQRNRIPDAGTLTTVSTTQGVLAPLFSAPFLTRGNEELLINIRLRLRNSTGNASYFSIASGFDVVNDTSTLAGLDVLARVGSPNFVIIRGWHVSGSIAIDNISTRITPRAGLYKVLIKTTDGGVSNQFSDFALAVKNDTATRKAFHFAADALDT